MQNPNSFDRIVSYFRALAREPFEYRGKLFEPYSKLIVTPSAFRSYSCPERCGACCMRCTLVFWTKPTNISTELEFLNVNGRALPFFVDRQQDVVGEMMGKCRHLALETGRCGIYEQRPLPCRLELFKFAHFTKRKVAYARVTRPGRAWQLLRIDGQRGAHCQIAPYDPEVTKTHIRDLVILGEWMDALAVPNDAQQLANWLDSRYSTKTLTIIR